MECGTLTLYLERQAEGSGFCTVIASGDVTPTANDEWQTKTIDIADHTVVADSAYELLLSHTPVDSNTTYIAIVGIETSERTM